MNRPSRRNMPQANSPDPPMRFPGEASHAACSTEHARSRRMRQGRHVISLPARTHRSFLKSGCRDGISTMSGRASRQPVERSIIARPLAPLSGEHPGRPTGPCSPLIFHQRSDPHLRTAFDLKRTEPTPLDRAQVISKNGYTRRAVHRSRSLGTRQQPDHMITNLAANRV